MLPLGHAAGGYIIGTIAATLTKSDSKNREVFQLVGLFGGLLPDLDLVLYHSLRKRFNLPAQIEHHTWFTHTFPFYVVLGSFLAFGATITRQPNWLKLIITMIAGSCIHLVQDMFGSGDGIMMLYPFSKRMFGIRLLNVHGKEWRKRYTSDPIFSLELLLIIIALVTLLKRNK